MKKVNFVNEMGNVDPKVRSGINEVVMPLIVEALTAKFGDRVSTNACGGGVSIALYEDATNGETIYARLDKTITQKSPDFKDKKSSKKKTETASIVIPDLD